MYLKIELPLFALFTHSHFDNSHFEMHISDDFHTPCTVSCPYPTLVNKHPTNYPRSCPDPAVASDTKYLLLNQGYLKVGSSKYVSYSIIFCCILKADIGLFSSFLLSDVYGLLLSLFNSAPCGMEATCFPIDRHLFVIKL